MSFERAPGLDLDMERTASGPDRIDCDLAALDRADFGVINLVAHLLLAARRGDCRLRIVNAPDGLSELMALSGLDRLPHLRVEMVRQTEQREEALGVQEEGDPADPIA
ncbi:MAG TPA: STAS domain-containing protein [Candidatus Limnocylindria bacterium]|jgi:ABC-type transporter Mla MlaB component